MIDTHELKKARFIRQQAYRIPGYRTCKGCHRYPSLRQIQRLKAYDGSLKK